MAIFSLSRAQKTLSHFEGAVVAMGALGIVTSLTLDLQPTYQMEQVVYQNLPFSELEHNLDAIFSSGYSVSLFTDWQNGARDAGMDQAPCRPGKAIRVATGVL